MSGNNVQIQDFVNVIESLYTERDPTKISAIQAYLQNIQKSDDCIRLADLLLSVPEYSLNCKFFGALSYTVHLTQHKSDHSRVDINSILPKLLFHLTTSINDYRFKKANNILVVKKLFQALSIIFNSYPVDHDQWKAPISCLLQILLTNKPPENTTASLEIDAYLPNIINDNIAVQLILALSSTIVEDLTRIGNDKQDVVMHETVKLYVYKETKTLIIACCESNNDVLKKSSLSCLSFWIQYISYAHYATILRYNDIVDILQYLILFLTNYSIESDIFQNTVAMLTDVFESNPALLNLELKNKFNELISSDWPTSKINEYFQVKDFENLESFVSLIISFLDIDQLKFASNIFKNENSRLLTFLLNLTNLPLKPIIEETISKKFIEFWCKLSEIFNDEFDSIEQLLKGDEELAQQIKNTARASFGEVSKIYFNKISLNIAQDSEFKSNASEFFSFRDDLSELFDSIYSSIGYPLFENLVANIVNNQDLSPIETSLFLLTSLSYHFSNDTAEQQVLSALDHLFQSNFLSNVTNLINTNTNESVRYLYAKTTIRFLGAIGFFYQSETTGSKYLTLVIDYLFNCLKDYPSQQAVTSKIILQICDDCRVKLTSQIPKFEPILVEMVRNQEIPSYTREKLINSISCIIQSIPEPSIQLDHVSHIIDLIETAAQPSLIQASSNVLKEKDFQYLTSLFSSVLEVARGLQTPEDFEEQQPQLFNRFKEFYSQNPQSVIDIKQKVSKLIEIFVVDIDALSANSQINEIATQIYKAGLLEDFGPFSFSSASALEFAVKKLQKSTPTTYAFLLELLVTVFNVGLRGKSFSHQRISDNDVSNVLNTFIIDKWDIIQSDPDLTQISVSLFSSIVQNKPNFFIHDRNAFQFIVKTSISLLYTKEKFIIRSVSKFWTGLISAKKLSSEEAEVLRGFIENDIGAFLTYNVFNALIDASRSDIEHYGNILVLLLARHTLRFKDWARDALEKINSERINAGAPAIQDRQVFLKKVQLTRGSMRRCNDLIKEFWISVNGLISYK